MGLNAITGRFTRTSNGGAFVPTADYHILGGWWFQKALTAPKNVVASAAATVQLTPQQSGSTLLFDQASGVKYILPPPALGLTYDFVVTTTVTSNSHEVDTDAATTFLLGAVLVATADATPSSTAGPKLEVANGTSTVKIASNGTTTGGIKGQQYRLTCVSSTVWQVSGFIYGSGTIATPFA